MKNKAYKIHSNCVFVHGYKKSTFCDLFRLRYKSMPSHLAKILESLDGVPISGYSKLLNNSEVTDFLAFLSQLEKEDYIQFTSINLKPQWGKWDDRFHYPGQISCAILNIENTSNYDIVNTLKKISSIGCESVSIIIKNNINYKELITLVNKGSLHSSINIIDTYIDSEIYISKSIIQLLRANKRYSNLYFSKIKNPKILNKIPLYNIYQNFQITNSINPDDFKVNPLLYNESLKYNTYYHKKLILNIHGEIIF
ncbi:MAG: hypothetical protein P8I82_02430 [Flavobacteriales bacterium]|nr:hypothetical protein [Flavobacteriales bacterium]